MQGKDHLGVRDSALGRARIYNPSTVAVGSAVCVPRHRRHPSPARMELPRVEWKSTHAMGHMLAFSKHVVLHFKTNDAAKEQQINKFQEND